MFTFRAPSLVKMYSCILVPLVLVILTGRVSCVDYKKFEFPESCGKGALANATAPTPPPINSDTSPFFVVAAKNEAVYPSHPTGCSVNIEAPQHFGLIVNPIRMGYVFTGIIRIEQLDPPVNLFSWEAGALTGGPNGTKAMAKATNDSVGKVTLRLVVTFTNQQSWDGLDFKILFTPFQRIVSNATDGKCNDGYFNCGDGLCILSTLQCEGNSNCINGKDETNCHITLYLAIAGTAFAVVVAVTLLKYSQSLPKPKSSSKTDTTPGFTSFVPKASSKTGMGQMKSNSSGSAFKTEPPKPFNEDAAD